MFLDKVYVVPVEECSTAKTLRFTSPKNGQTTYNKAENYLITNVFSKTKKLNQSKENYKNRNSNIKERVTYYCSDCGKEVTKEGNKCLECARKSSRKVDRPERDELKQLIQTKPFSEIGRAFGVNDKSIVKWCISYNLPSKKSEIKIISEDDWKLI